MLIDSTAAPLLFRLLLGLLPVATAIGLAVPAMAQQTSIAELGLVSPDQLAALLEREDFAFINVHIPNEGEIAQTDAHIPFDQISTDLGQLPSDKSARIVLYCRSGRMSDIAGAELVRLGYTNVSHLEGGFIAWEQSGRELLHN
jgi:rhodanese-related sulfurtransferase